MRQLKHITALILLVLLAAGCLAAQDQVGPPLSFRLLTDVEYARAGDHPLLLNIVVPKGVEGKKLPLVVWIHGGGWRGGDKSQNVAVWLANHDYIVASIDYRLTDVAPFPAQIYDCKAAIRFLRAHAKEYSIDPKRIGVWGGSAGGHLVALLGTSGGVKELEGNLGNPKQSSRVQAVCDFFGPTDLTALGKFATTPKPVVLLLGGEVKDKMAVAKAASPITYVTRDDAPILIVHGDRDNLVPIRQSEMFYDALKKAGVNATFIRVKNSGHGFPASGIEPSRDEIMRTVREFFDRWLKR